MPDLRFVRAHDRHLSLWQSAVAENARRQIGDEASHAEVLAHPLMTAANDHVEAVLTKGRNAVLEPGDHRQTAAYLSQVALARGMALVDGDSDRAAALDVEFRKYSDDDPGFLSCETTYLTYYKEYSGAFLYNDWTKQGGGDINYGVIEWQLPSDAVLGVIGDWGTGLDDGKELLRDLMVQHSPTAIIHLGDIYYSATPAECQANYADIYTEVFDEVLGAGNRLPVFTLAGNHDYYALGYGFLEMVNTMNATIPGATQAASYFCLRTADNGWQFLAMDTGYNDSNPLDQFDTTYAGPWLQPTEVQWLQNKLVTFPGATVLLSHHQLFSANAKLNGSFSPYGDLQYLNPFLHKAFEPYFDSDVAGWLWGHEHNFVAYRNGIFGLAKGRLLGCSAYEELVSSDPYKVNYPEVPYLDPVQYRLGSAAGYYNHAYAVIDLGNRAQPTAQVSISYYQYPSWGTTAPPSPASSLVLSEHFTRPVQPVPQNVTYGTPLYLLADEGLYVAPLSKGTQNYPTMSIDSPVALTITGGSGVVKHGDRVQVKTTEPAAGSYNTLGAWTLSPWLYYYTPGYGDKQTWIVQKLDPSQPEVQYGDEICLVNKSFTGQTMQPNWSRVYATIYLTTQSGDPYYWTARPATPAPAPYQTRLLDTGTPIPEADGAANSAGWALGDFNLDGVPDLFDVKVRNTGTGKVEVHILSGASGFQSWLLETGTPILEADGAANFGGWAVADFNGDDVPDLFGIKVRNTGTGNVEVHVLDGATGFQDFLLQTGTPILEADGAANFGGWALADFNGDGVPDLFAIKVRNTGTGKVEVHVLDGATGFQDFLLQTPTAILEADGAANFGGWALGDYSDVGVPDLFGVKVTNTGTGKVEVHVLSGASHYQNFLLQAPTAILQADGAANTAAWPVADFNGDGVPDLSDIKVRNTGTDNVEVHVLSGA